MGVYMRPISTAPQPLFSPTQACRVKARPGPGMVPRPVSGATPASSMNWARRPPPRSSLPRKPMRDAALPPSSSRLRRVAPDLALLMWTSTMPNISTLLWAHADVPRAAMPPAASQCLCFTNLSPW